MKILTLVWGPFGFRADELAEAVGSERESITFLYGPRYFAPVRYFALLVKTAIILLRKRPEVVIAQNPPVFCPLACLAYCRMRGARLIVDHHSVWRVKTLGRGPLSKSIGFLEAFVARSAFANTAPHRFWAKQLSQMGARRVEVIHDFVPRNPRPRDERLRETLSRETTIAISSHGGHPLERMESEAAAAGMTPEVALIITGPIEKLKGRLVQDSLPANVRYAGFLPRETYETLKASADFALNITDEPYTLSHVLLEFAASSLPVISSRQEVVEDFFGDSLFYASSSSPRDVAVSIRAFLDTQVRGDYRSRIIKFQDSLAERREQEVSRLRALILQSGV